jgi:hypothetical protein
MTAPLKGTHPSLRRRLSVPGRYGKNECLGPIVGTPKNRWEIRGTTGVIFMDRRDGTQLECLVDEADLGLALSYPFKWHAGWNKESKTFYVSARTLGDGGPACILLHRFLTRCPDGYHVDHRNHDGLNNTRLPPLCPHCGEAL